MAKHGLRGKTRPSFYHIRDKVSRLKHCSFPWFCSSMSLHPAALNHRICPRGLSSTRSALTKHFCSVQDFAVLFSNPLTSKRDGEKSANIPAGDKPRKAPCTRSVFLLFSSSPPPPPRPRLLPHLPASHRPQWAVFRPTALRFQTLSCLSRELAGLQATKYDVNKLDRGSFHICFRPQTRGARGPTHRHAVCTSPAAQSGPGEAGIGRLKGPVREIWRAPSCGHEVQ